MKLTIAAFVVIILLLPGIRPLFAQSADPGWPRIYKKDGKQLTVYQPQVDYWHGYTNIHFRCAIAVKGVLKQEKFGVAEIDAVTVTDQAARIVALVATQRDLRFSNCQDSEVALLRNAVDELRPPGAVTTLSLDRAIAYLDPREHATQTQVSVNLDPPKIFYSRQPSILVVLMGEAQFKPVDTNRTDLLFALNTNWDLFYDATTLRYYLLNQDSWLTARDVKGSWSSAGSLPASFSSLPANDNWADVHANLPGKPARFLPVVFVSTEPAELITTQGNPDLSPIKGTRLMRVVNTESVLFFNPPEAKYYYLIAGRWFRATNLDGPWSAASRDLPADFARIPDNDPASFVKACVPGTREASDAILLASVPATTTVYVTNPPVQVFYEGVPQFMPIQTTTVQYAVNTHQQVFLVGGKYYCCDAGVWFNSSSAVGPWEFCTQVPAAIYSIPVTSPCHNVTYVVVQSSTPTTVVYAQTAGYSGEYVAATGVLMFGAGMLAGAAIANNNNHYHYYPPYPCHYSYGCGASYHYGYGGYYYKGGAAYGPYGGAGYATSYHPSTGTYSRSAYAYGPYGSASSHATYNPYTGGFSRSAQVNTVYGSAGRAAGYNPYTGTSAQAGYRSTAYGSAAAGRAYNPYSGASAAGASINTAYGSASRGAAYNPTTGQGARTASRSGQYGSASAIQTTGGGSAAAWNTANSQGVAGKTQSGNVYAAKDGTVYKKNNNGNWSQNSGSGWQSVSKPQMNGTTSKSYQTTTAQPKTTSYQPESQSSWSQNKASLQSQAESRSWGNQQHQNAQSWQSSGGSRSWSNSRSGGGRRR